MSSTLASPQPISRRRFLKAGCLTVAAAGMGVCGLTAVAPVPGRVEPASQSFGGTAVNRRVLIAYSTYAGSTAEIAARLGETLAARGFAVDVRPVQEQPDVDGYQAVLIGSAVHFGQWLPEAVEWVKARQAALSRLPVSLFCVHITNRENDPQTRKRRLAYLDAVRPLVPAAAEAFFPGKFDSRGAALLLPRLVARLVPTMDLRDWGQVRAWAESLAE